MAEPYEGWFVCVCGWTGDVVWHTDDAGQTEYAFCPRCDHEMELAVMP